MDNQPTQPIQSPQVPVQPQIPVPVSLPQKKPWKLFAVLFGGIVLIIGIASIVFVSQSRVQTTQHAMQPTTSTQTENLSPTPFPFQELTIPYLRNKTYVSTLGEQEFFADNGSYTSYLTNYTSDGFRINGLLTKPAGEMPAGGWPAIVFVHGYIPPTQYQTTERYVDYVDYLARNGFVVFKIDLRGHGNSEGEPGGGYYGSDYVVDALNAHAALASSDFVDPKKIGMWGHSMGGNVLLRSLAVKPDIPAIVIWAGAVYSYTDMQTYRISDTSYMPLPNVSQQQSRRRELFEKYGSPSAESKFWQQVAPTNFLGDMNGAIQLHHAVDDDTVNVGYSRDLQALLTKTDVPHEVYEYASGGHDIAGASFSEAMQRTVDFFHKYLGK